MIIDLPSTTTVGDQQEAGRPAGDAAARSSIGRVLTLVIVTDEAPSEDADRGGQRRLVRAPLPGDRGRPRRRGAARPGWTRRSGSAVTPAPARSIVLRLFGELADHGASA